MIYFINDGTGISSILFYIQSSGERERERERRERERERGERERERERERDVKRKVPKQTLSRVVVSIGTPFWR